jgi:hemerythrin
MRLKGYDEYSDHVKDHTRIHDILRELSINHALGSPMFSAGKVDGVFEFINHHIVTRDRRFEEYLLRENWK